MSDEKDQSTAPRSKAKSAGDPMGLNQVGGEKADKLPDGDIAIELPIEEGDFNAQPQ